KQQAIIRNNKRISRNNDLLHTFTYLEWLECLNHFEYKCAYCGEEKEEMHQDHFYPFSKDGEYTKQNIVPACRNCNCSKRHSEPFEWYRTKPFYSTEREQQILNYLGINNNG